MSKGGTQLSDDHSVIQAVVDARRETNGEAVGSPRGRKHTAAIRLNAIGLDKVIAVDGPMLSVISGPSKPSQTVAEKRAARERTG